MIKVLVVDDSAVAREFLVHLINGTSDMTVVGTAADGLEAIEAVQRHRPDIITMDIIMPRLGGPEAIDRIMQLMPTPIVVVTGNTITEEVRATFESLESGALAIVPRPYGRDSRAHDASAKHLLQTLRLMSEVKVVRRLPRPATGASAARNVPGERHPFRVVAIGASTGGPSALRAIVSELRQDFPAPILVVQHIAAGFVEGFVSWMRNSSVLPIQLAAQGDKLRSGTIYVAPDGMHMGVDHEERIALSDPGQRMLASVCPSADHLFDAVRRVFGPQAIGILLTGMGRDGAEALLRMRQAGAITIAQDKESSVVHGMPGEAITLGAADFVLPPSRIAELLTTFARTSYPAAK